MKASYDDGSLREIPGYFIKVPAARFPFNCSSNIGGCNIHFTVLPEISISGSSKYNQQNVIGRGASITTYENTENMRFNIKMTFYANSKNELYNNYRSLIALKSALYPREASIAPYTPPSVCNINCGRILYNVCAILESINETYPTDVVWDENELIPYLFYLDTSWSSVYAATDLPNQSKILALGNF